MVYFGGGIKAAEAERELLELAERIDAPIACSLMGISSIPSNHPRFLGMEGMHGHYAATTAMRSSFSLRLNVLFMLHHSFLNKKIQMKGLISKGNAFAIFSHPDYTRSHPRRIAGLRIRPRRILPSVREFHPIGSRGSSQTITAGMEFHQSPKLCVTLRRVRRSVGRSIE
jgi:hypothetical protein